MNRCLGKLPARHDSRTILLKTMIPLLPYPPPARNWANKLPADVGMFSNDQIGDCTCASAAHLIQTWTSQIGMISNPTNAQVVLAYERFGYDPSDPTSDQGANMLDVLNSWRKLGIGEHRIGAFARIDQADVDHVKAAIDYFGGVYVGAMLPTSAQNLDQDWIGSKDMISPSDRPGGWGGHCMAAVAYDRTGVTFLTWGKRQIADWQWWLNYIDEAYAIVSTDWLEPDGLAPVGLPVSQLNAFLGSL